MLAWQPVSKYSSCQQLSGVQASVHGLYPASWLSLWEACAYAYVLPVLCLPYVKRRLATTIRASAFYCCVSILEMERLRPRAGQYMPFKKVLRGRPWSFPMITFSPGSYRHCSGHNNTGVLLALSVGGSGDKTPKPAVF